MNEELSKYLGLYRDGLWNRRELLQSVVAITGSYATVHLLLESNGLAATAISAQESGAASQDVETIQYLSGDSQITAYLAKPKSSGKQPGIILVHDERGLTEHIRDVARRFASEGFVALAPDLFSRSGGTARMKSVEETTAAFRTLSPEENVRDLKAGYEFLAKNPDVTPDKISAVGFSFGGWRSFLIAAEVPSLYRAIIFYGATPPAGLDKIQAPVLAHYAQLDHQVTGNALNTEKTMKQLGKKFTYYVYPNTYRAFFNDTGDRYDPNSAKLAWTRTLEFLRT